MAASRHGSAVRGMDNVPRSSIRDQRFGRMFRHLPPADFSEKGLILLGRTMAQGEFAAKSPGFVDTPLNEREDEDENPRIPAGYTYLGQFIDHDITFDPTSSLDRFNDPDALQDFRTPRLDLDSVYGSGPADQPFLYEDDEKHLVVGDDRDFDKTRKNRPDLPRNNANPRRALIGDKRNDENSIVSQLHTTFIRFHNRVVDSFPDLTFSQVQQVVRWHYQWIVLHDFLPRVVGNETYRKVILASPNAPSGEPVDRATDILGGEGVMPDLRFYDAKGRYAYIPVEFSVAAYRFGHSMVRPSYALNPVARVEPEKQLFNDKPVKFHRIPIFSLAPEPCANLNGFRELPDLWAVDWSFFFDGVPRPQTAPQDAVLPQPSYKLDTTLVDPLSSLPDHQKEVVDRRALATLNLLRGWRMDLPSGQAVARFMGINAITDADLFISEDGAREKLLADGKNKFTGSCPLWFYVLREAEILGNSEHLGPVGGTIVAEVLAGLIIEDRQSFLSQWPKWRPTLPGATPGHFTMADLINLTNGEPVATA